MEETDGGPLPVKSFNIVFCGESGVGKTALIKRYTTDEYKTTSDSTVGMEHFIWNGLPRNVAQVQYEIKLSIWDGGGKEQYRQSLRRLHSMADVQCFCFDLTNTDTLDAIVNVWLETTRWTLNGRVWGNHDRRLPVVAYLIGTKSDLVEQRKITSELGEQIAKSHGMTYFETSAKNNQGLLDLFDHITEYAHAQVLVGTDPGYNIEYPDVIEYQTTSSYSLFSCCPCFGRRGPLFIEE